MANYTVDKIKYGSNVYILKDGNALPLTGGSVTGPVIFGDAVTADSISTGDLVVTGSASFANNLQVVTINGVTVGSSPKFTDTTYTANTTSIGSASAGTAISADDITAWTTNTPTAVTKKTVVTSASGATAAVANGVLTLTNGSFGTGDSVTVTAGTAASLSYTSRSIPNISVTSKTVATGITAS